MQGMSRRTDITVYMNTRPAMSQRILHLEQRTHPQIEVSVWPLHYSGIQIYIQRSREAYQIRENVGHCWAKTTVKRAGLENQVREIDRWMDTSSMVIEIKYEQEWAWTSSKQECKRAHADERGEGPEVICVNSECATNRGAWKSNQTRVQNAHQPHWH
jgi:hypothetical protein